MIKLNKLLHGVILCYRIFFQPQPRPAPRSAVINLQAPRTIKKGLVKTIPVKPYPMKIQSRKVTGSLHKYKHPGIKKGSAWKCNPVFKIQYPMKNQCEYTAQEAAAYRMFPIKVGQFCSFFHGGRRICLYQQLTDTKSFLIHILKKTISNPTKQTSIVQYLSIAPFSFR